MRAEDIALSNLDNGPGILPFNLGSSKIISHHHSFLQIVNLELLKFSVESVHDNLQAISPQLNNKTLSLYEPHIEYLKYKLSKISDQLLTFGLVRAKRGLIDGLGSVIKSISGNLDYTDAIKYDNAIKTLSENENKIANELNNHISIEKRWTSESFKTISSLKENQLKIEKTVNLILNSAATVENELIKYAHLAQLLLILGDNIDSLSEELIRLENLLAFIRVKSTHHSMLSTKTFKSMLLKIRTLYKSENLLDLNIREYFDVMKLGYYYDKENIILVFKVPIVYPRTYNLYKLSLVPNKNNEVIIPTYPYIAMHENDFMYMEAECPKTSLWYICEARSSYLAANQRECIFQLITNQDINESCKPTSIFLSTAAFEKLDEKHYTVSFPKPTKVRLSCKEDQYTTLKGSYLSTIPKGCFLQSPEFTISNVHDHVQGQAVKILDVPANENLRSPINKPTFNLNTINLEDLHTSKSELLAQSPLHLSELQMNSIYHTTIPMYLLILGIVAALLSFICRKIIIKRRLSSKSDTKDDIEINEIKEAPSSAGLASSSISALFSAKTIK